MCARTLTRTQLAHAWQSAAWVAATDPLTRVSVVAALIHILRKRAASRCGAEQKAYADCVRGRVISVVRLLRPGGPAARKAPACR